jgi:hypothetical protein
MSKSEVTKMKQETRDEIIELLVAYRWGERDTRDTTDAIEACLRGEQQ